MPLVGLKTLPWTDYLEMEKYLLAQLEDNFSAGTARLLFALAARSQDASLDWKHEIATQGDACITDPTLDFLRRMYLLGLLDRIENREGQLIAQAQAGKPLDFPSLAADFNLLWTSLEQYAAGFELPWIRDHEVRYLRSLLQRRMLPQPPGLLENLLALSLLPLVIETYTYANALARGAAEPEPGDLFVGIEKCERDLVTHGREAYAMTGSYLKFLQDRQRQLRSQA